jgi:prepilin-type N-terminal cleavage/methylation domain-containing protein
MTSAHLRSRRTRRTSTRGYTAVEVLIAMTLFAIGAAGVIGMQRVTIQGGEDARRFDMATNIANEWISRLQRDATYWTQPNSAFPNKINLDKTRWLKNVDTCGTTFCNIPMPAAPADGLSPAFDNFGRDLPAGITTEAMYCVQYRLLWIAPPGLGPAYPPPLKLTGLMRAEVRVYWANLEANPIGNCGTPPPEVIPAASPYHFVYATTAIREAASR